MNYKNNTTPKPILAKIVPKIPIHKIILTSKKYKAVKGPNNKKNCINRFYSRYNQRFQIKLGDRKIQSKER
jgi:hypothetical protein